MGSQSATSLGHWVWFELSTTDIAAAIAFYAPVMGWTVHKFDPADPHAYAHICASQGDLGGITLLQDQAKAMGVPPNWRGYVHVADVDATVAQVKALGGQCYVTMDLPGTGRFAIIADPQGAPLALFTPESDGPLHNRRQPGEFNWCELMADDPDAAFAFYSALFGWEKKGEVDMGPMGTYHLYGLGDQQLGGIFKRPAAVSQPVWLYYVMVADVDASVAAAKAGGAQLLHGPAPVPGGGRIAQFVDPQGAVFAIVG